MYGAEGTLESVIVIVIPLTLWLELDGGVGRLS